MKPDYAMRALPKLLFGGELFRDYDETKRALLVDALCLLLMLMGLAVDARGQSQEQAQSQAQQASSEAQAATQATQSQPQTQKNPPEKKKKVFTADDLAALKGGVSVVGNANAAATDSSAKRNPSEAAGGGGAGKNGEKDWRDRAAKIHTQMDEVDQQIKDLKADIQKNGASGFDPQTGLKENIIYVDDKNARLQKLQKKRAELDQNLDDLQEEGRRAGIPTEWVR